jgi:hypothetical protein
MKIEILEDILVSVRREHNSLILDGGIRELKDWEKKKMDAYGEVREILENILYPLYDQRALEDTDTWEH